MDLGATMHRDMIYHATCEDSSTYAGSRGWKRRIFDLSRETAIRSRHNIYAIETNVERCLTYISSNVQKDSRLSLNGEQRYAYLQPSKSTKYTQNTHFLAKSDTTKPIQKIQSIQLQITLTTTYNNNIWKGLRRKKIFHTYTPDNRPKIHQNHHNSYKKTKVHFLTRAHSSTASKLPILAVTVSRN